MKKHFNLVKYLNMNNGGMFVLFDEIVNNFNEANIIFVYNGIITASILKEDIDNWNEIESWLINCYMFYVIEVRIKGYRYEG